MVRYMECSTCGKSLLENSIIVVRTGFTDKYCSMVVQQLVVDFLKI